MAGCSFGCSGNCIYLFIWGSGDVRIPWVYYWQGWMWCCRCGAGQWYWTLSLNSWWALGMPKVFCMNTNKMHSIVPIAIPPACVSLQLLASCWPPSFRSGVSFWTSKADHHPVDWHDQNSLKKYSCLRCHRGNKSLMLDAWEPLLRDSALYSPVEHMPVVNFHLWLLEVKAMFSLTSHRDPPSAWAIFFYIFISFRCGSRCGNNWFTQSFSPCTSRGILACCYWCYYCINLESDLNNHVYDERRLIIRM